MPNTFPSFSLLPAKSKTKTQHTALLVVSLATSLKRAHCHSILFITGKKRGGGGPSRITLGRKSPLRLSWTLPVRSVAVKVRWSLCHFSLSLLVGGPCTGWVSSLVSLVHPVFKPSDGLTCSCCYSYQTYIRVHGLLLFLFRFLNASPAAGSGGDTIILSPPLLTSLQLMPYLGKAPGTLPGR